MKALTVIKRGSPPPNLPEGSWYPPAGAQGVVVRVSIPDLDFTGRMLAFWPSDPDMNLRIVDLWDAGIEVTGEQFLPEGHPIHQKVSKVLTRKDS